MKERSNDKESLLAFCFDEDGLPYVVKIFMNEKDKYALIALARMVIDSLSVQAADEMTQRRLNAL